MLLELRDVAVTRGTATVLRDVSLTMEPGERLAILGRNGMGKTTLVLGLLGLTRAIGSIEFRGRQLVGMPTHKIVQSGIQYVPEDRQIFASLTVEENLRLASVHPDSVARLDKVCRIFPDLSQRAKQPAGTLSGGQQQMLAIARALAIPCNLLLLDEPSKGLSPAMVDAMVTLIDAFVEESALMIVEQNLAVAAHLATSYLGMRNGSVHDINMSVDGTVSRDQVEELLGVSEVKTHG